MSITSSVGDDELTWGSPGFVFGMVAMLIAICLACGGGDYLERWLNHNDDNRPNDKSSQPLLPVYTGE